VNFYTKIKKRISRRDYLRRSKAEQTGYVWSNYKMRDVVTNKEKKIGRIIVASWGNF